MSAARRVDRLIVGGGIGGLAAALAIARQGLSVHVLEQAHSFEEIGAGIQLGPNALRVLDELGVMPAVVADAVLPPMATLTNAITGDRIGALDFGPKFREAYGYPYVVTHRTDLLDAILRGCTSSALITLETHKKVVAVDDGFETVGVRCADGSSYETGLLIGADGIWSAVRRHVVGDDEPAYVGDVAYRGTVPIDALSQRADIDNMTWWIGPHLHMVQYPVRRRGLINQVAVFTAEASGSDRDPDSWGPPDELDRRFADTNHFVQEAVRLLDRSRRWILRDRVPASTWTRHHTTLLGDAAHPMAQYLAQGACQALEDAAVLARCLAAYPSDVRKALLEYETRRIPRTAFVQQWARRMGELVHADGLLASVRNELLARHDADDFRYVDWLYGYRADDLLASA